MNAAAERLVAVMRQVDHLAKRDKNTHQGFNFRGIDAVLNAVGPALREHGLTVLPVVRSVDACDVTVGAKRTPMRSVTVVCAYQFTADDGSYVECVSVGEAMDSGDKATPKAMSVALRTALIQALALPTDEPDPDSHTYERAPSVVVTDPSTWPTPTVPASLAKQAVLAACGGDKDAAKAWWTDNGADPMDTVELTEAFASLGGGAAAWPEGHEPFGDVDGES